MKKKTDNNLITTFAYIQSIHSLIFCYNNNSQHLERKREEEEEKKRIKYQLFENKPIFHSSQCQNWQIELHVISFTNKYLYLLNTSMQFYLFSELFSIFVFVFQFFCFISFLSLNFLSGRVHLYRYLANGLFYLCKSTENIYIVEFETHKKQKTLKEFKKIKQK